MRFSKEFKPYAREITKRRIFCARRALQKQRDKIPLFADQLNQPTPMERIVDFDKKCFSCFVRFRAMAAENWIEGRRLLRLMNIEKKKRFLDYWNRSSIPGKAEYFLDSVRRFEVG